MNDGNELILGFQFLVEEPWLLGTFIITNFSNLSGLVLDDHFGRHNGTPHGLAVNSPVMGEETFPYHLALYHTAPRRWGR